jgi:hypothetical protein
MGRGGKGNSNLLYQQLSPDYPENKNQYLIKQAQKNPHKFAELWFKEFEQQLINNHYQTFVVPMLESFNEQDWEELDYDIHSYVDGQIVVLDTSFIGLPFYDGTQVEARMQELDRNLHQVTIRQMLAFDFYLSNEDKRKNLFYELLAEEDK